MSGARARRPAVEGWFTMDTDAPALLGSRCPACGTYAFPAETLGCRNPDCTAAGDEGSRPEPVELSRRGTVWSYTNACYTPPAPYVAAEPFDPFCIAAVELEREQMVVMGQMAAGVGVEDLAVGDTVEVVLGRLYADDETDVMVWQWRPVGAGDGAGARAGDGTGAAS